MYSNVTIKMYVGLTLAGPPCIMRLRSICPLISGKTSKWVKVEKVPWDDGRDGILVESWGRRRMLFLLGAQVGVGDEVVVGLIGV